MQRPLRNGQWSMLTKKLEYQQTKTRCIGDYTVNCTTKSFDNQNGLAGNSLCLCSSPGPDMGAGVGCGFASTMENKTAKREKRKSLASIVSERKETWKSLFKNQRVVRSYTLNAITLFPLYKPPFNSPLAQYFYFYLPSYF